MYEAQCLVLKIPKWKVRSLLTRSLEIHTWIEIFMFADMEYGMKWGAHTRKKVCESAWEFRKFLYTEVQRLVAKKAFQPYSFSLTVLLAFSTPMPFSKMIVGRVHPTHKKETKTRYQVCCLIIFDSFKLQFQVGDQPSQFFQDWWVVWGSSHAVLKPG